MIEVTTSNAPLRAAMIDYGLGVLALSVFIAAITAALLFAPIRIILVRSIWRVVAHMQRSAWAPKDARNLSVPWPL